MNGLHLRWPAIWRRLGASSTPDLQRWAEPHHRYHTTTHLAHCLATVVKGIMFAVIVVMSGAGVLIHEGVWFRLGLLLICLWAACRFYYFLFYVLERYVGVKGRYAGILDLCQRLWRKRKP